MNFFHQKYFGLLPLISLVLLIQNAEHVHSARIAALLFFCSKSMKNAFDPLLTELANRGHQLTVVSPIKPSQSHPNITNIVGPDNKGAIKTFGNSFDRRAGGSVPHPMRGLFPFIEIVCRSHYELPEVKALRNETFDLVITNGIYNECVFGLIHHLNATFIGLSTIASPPWVSRSMGAPVPPSFVPFHLLQLTDSMTFLERVWNFYRHFETELNRRFYYNPIVEAIYRDYYPDAPSILEMGSKYSLVLMNSHPTLNYPRPTLPDMVEIGGIHCRPAKPLSFDLEEFVQSSGDHGFIVFSMGSIIPGNEMPLRFRQAFLRAFEKLKQKVIWKWETETMEEEQVPSNVKLVKWLPQQDLLGHPKMKLFITHGGLLSTEEAVYHGVPLIGIPIFADQDLNMRQAEHHGFGLTLEMGDISEEILSLKINTILNNTRFSERAKYLSNIFRDQLGSPLDRAVYWTEYIIRHKGAPHLRSAGRDLNFLAYYSLDVIAALLATLVGLGYALYLFAKHVLYRIVILIWEELKFNTVRLAQAKKLQ